MVAPALTSSLSISTLRKPAGSSRRSRPRVPRLQRSQAFAGTTAGPPAALAPAARRPVEDAAVAVLGPALRIPVQVECRVPVGEDAYGPARRALLRHPSADGNPDALAFLHVDEAGGEPAVLFDPDVAGFVVHL